MAKEGVKTFIDYAEANKNGAQFRYGLNTFNQEYRKVKEPPDTASTAQVLRRIISSWAIRTSFLPMAATRLGRTAPQAFPSSLPT